MIPPSFKLQKSFFVFHITGIWESPRCKKRKIFDRTNFFVDIFDSLVNPSAWHEK